MTIQRFPFDKISQEKLVLVFNFSNGLAAGEILVGAPTVLISVARGQDTTPNAVFNGACEIDASLKMVLQPIQGGIKGAEYLFRVVAPTSNGLKVLAIEAILAVI